MRTAPEEVSLDRLTRARAGRRLFFLAVTAFVALGAFGFFGVTTSTTTATGGGYELSVDYASRSRSGLASPLKIEIRRPGGFGRDTVELATTSSYLDIFDQNSIEPEPTESTDDGERVFWTFTVPPGGETLSVTLDVRIEPGVQLATARATTWVLEDGAEPVSVDYSTLVLP